MKQLGRPSENHQEPSFRRERRGTSASIGVVEARTAELARAGRAPRAVSVDHRLEKTCSKAKHCPEVQRTDGSGRPRRGSCRELLGDS